jgi:prepilin-type N-terminal cleavage/methylation domain-containing protein
MHNKGFTLVELAIVIVIIGLLVGALSIRSSAVIGSASTTQSLVDIKDLIEATKGFKMRYHYLPGDLPAAGDDIPNTSTGCNIPTSASGIGNGLVDTANERTCVAEQLVNGAFIKGATDGIRIGGSNAPNATISSRRVVGSLPPSFTALNEVQVTDLNCDTANAIDRALDDGNFATGTVRASMASCVTNDVVPILDISI